MTASASGFELYRIKSISAQNAQPLDLTDDGPHYAFFSTSTGVEGFEIAILAKGDAIGNGNKGGYVLLQNGNYDNTCNKLYYDQ